MSVDTLGRLETAHENLIAALDANDVDQIENRVDALRSAISDVRAQGGWRDLPELKSRARRIASLGEAARIRVNFLTDLNNQRLQLLSAARGEALGAAYARPARAAVEA